MLMVMHKSGVGSVHAQEEMWEGALRGLVLAAVGLRWWVMENPPSARACERGGWGRVRAMKMPIPDSQLQARGVG